MRILNPGQIDLQLRKLIAQFSKRDEASIFLEKPLKDFGLKSADILILKLWVEDEFKIVGKISDDEVAAISTGDDFANILIRVFFRSTYPTSAAKSS